MKNLAKNFFSSKVGKIGIWVFLWLFEYFVLSWCVNKLPANVIMGCIIIGYISIIYPIYYWIVEECSTELQIYALIIFEFVFCKLNQESAFVKVFNCPFWVVYIVLFVYFLIRLFVIKKVYYVLRSILCGLAEVQKERIQQRINETAIRQEKEAENAECIKKQRTIRHQLWSNFGKKIAVFFFNIIDFFVAIPAGLLRRRQRPVKKAEKTETDSKTNNFNGSNKNIRMPIWVYIVIVIILFIFLASFALLVYYQIHASHNDISQSTDADMLTKFLRNLSVNNNSAELAPRIISLLIIDSILIIIFMIIAFITFVVAIQIIKSGIRMVKDLIESTRNPQGTDHSSTVFYGVIVFIICFFAYKLYPFDSDDFAELLSNGAFIIYPIMAAIFIPIITAIIDVLNKESIKNYLKGEKVAKVKNQFIDLATGTLGAILNYLTFVTKDFLQSIQELSTEEFIESDDREEENNENSSNPHNCNSNSHGNSIPDKDHR